MNAENFTEYLSNPSLLYQVPYEELKSLALEYPYCAHLRWLLLQKSRMEHRADAPKALEKAAVYSIDRRALYELVQTYAQYDKAESASFHFTEDYLELKDLAVLKEELPAAAPPEKAIERPAPTPPIRETPAPVAEEAEEELVFEFTPPAPAMPVEETVLTESETSVPVEESVEEAVQDFRIEAELVDDAVALSSLVEYQNVLAAADAVLEKAAQVQAPATPAAPMSKANFKSWSRPAPMVTPPSKPETKAPTPPPAPEKKIRKAPDLVTEIARKSVRENADLATETLADLLAAQQQYDKAIKMYQRLILKFPEKSTYFAGKIEKLKRR